MKDYFIGRQPILDEKGHIYAYEVLFRSQNSLAAGVTDNAAATARVLINALQNIGLDTLLGNKKGFINADENIIMEGAIDLLPKERIVIEILETSNITPEVVSKIKKYIEDGYNFALDDVEFTKEYFNKFRELFNIVEYIKLDYMLAEKTKLAQNVGILKRFKAKMLAEKVESQEEYEHCKTLGCKLFQGYYFSKPIIISGKSVDPSKAATVQLINLLREDAEAFKLEQVIKNYPDLYINLLKFMNSSAFFTRGQITSIRHAMSMLGRQNLAKWLYLVLYAGPNNDRFDNPLLQTAQVRAVTMEKLCKLNNTMKNKADSAYLVGLLSMLDAVFNKELAEIVKEFNVDDEIRDAVVDKKGWLGILLSTVISYETDDMEKLVRCFNTMKISFEEFNRVILESYSYADKFLLHEG